MNEEKDIVVDRADQIDDVKKKLGTGGSSPSQNMREKTILEWYGIPGIGKTTLERKAIYNLCKEKSVPITYIDFASADYLKATTEYSQERECVHLLDLVIQAIDSEKENKYITKFNEERDVYVNANEDTAKKDIFENVVDAFLDFTFDLLERHYLVLSFDSTEKFRMQTFRVLEEKIILPLTFSEKCIIVWCGEKKQKWRPFQVRFRVLSRKLPGLSLSATEEQTGLKDINIYKITKGYPKANECLKRLISAKPEIEEVDNEKELVAKSYEVIQKEIFSVLPPGLDNVCRIMSVGRLFVHDMLENLLPQYSDSQRLCASNNIISDLRNLSLVEWDNENKGYSLDKMIRHILSRYMEIFDTSKFVEYNEKMRDIFSSLIEKFNEFRSIYMLQKLYHIAVLEDQKKTPQSWTVLEGELRGYFKKYEGNDAKKRDMTINIFSEMISKDEELENILGVKGFRELKRCLESI